MPDAMFKVCIFGDGGVGKTSLVERYLTGVFTGDSSMTIGVDFHVKTIFMNDMEIGLQIWDFAGETHFRHILPRYTVGSGGGIFMYDLTRYSSLKNLPDWLGVFKEGLKEEDLEIPFLMVGGKLDLTESRSVSSDEAKDIAYDNDFAEYMECSAKTGQNVEEIFIKLTELLLKKSGLI